ncbi:hypothetical protein L5515_013977 [Caenorhabditis briggsae]|uniref:Uncharacterized protein n=1 Tax=Caenorhabditis briggsae TaxID=6238 RepID=A0AAE9E7W6_CAEBR|nr:hypothetical protein L5515_013977 [Caenorhabditis briggsae]
MKSYWLLQKIFALHLTITTQLRSSSIPNPVNQQEIGLFIFRSSVAEASLTPRIDLSIISKEEGNRDGGQKKMELFLKMREFIT